VVTPLVNFIGVKPTIMSATVAGLLSPPRPTPSYTTLRDVTKGERRLVISVDEHGEVSAVAAERRRW
jgi:hypothetical protein